MSGTPDQNVIFWYLINFRFLITDVEPGILCLCWSTRQLCMAFCVHTLVWYAGSHARYCAVISGWCHILDTHGGEVWTVGGQEMCQFAVTRVCHVAWEIGVMARFTTRTTVLCLTLQTTGYRAFYSTWWYSKLHRYMSIWTGTAGLKCLGMQNACFVFFWK